MGSVGHISAVIGFANYKKSSSFEELLVAIGSANDSTQDDYGLVADTLSADDNARVRQALGELGVNVKSNDDLTFYSSDVPEALLKKMEQSTKDDRELAADLRQHPHITTFKSDVDPVVRSFLPPASLERIADRTGIPKDSLRKLIAPHEMSHRFIDAKLGKNGWKGQDKELGELFSDCVSSVVVDPEYLFISRLEYRPYRILTDEIEKATAEVVKQNFPNLIPSELATLLKINVDYNIDPNAKEFSEFGSRPVDPGPRKTTTEVCYQTLKEFLKEHPGTGLSPELLLREISQQFVDDIKKDSLAKAREMKLIP